VTYFDPAPSRLLSSYDAECDGDWALGPDDGYFFQFLLYHLDQAGRREEAVELFHDLDWLLAKWRKAGARSLLADVALFPQEDRISGCILDFADEVNQQDLARVLRTPKSIARQAFWKGGPATYVLVAGTGNGKLTDAETFASEATGRTLARFGYGLISGGWPGVDHVVCREYILQLRRDETPSAGRLLFFVPEGKEPGLWQDTALHGEGDVISAGRESHAAASSVERAQALVLIGGKRSAHQILELAEKRELPVFPWTGTGGVAASSAGRETLELQFRSRRDALSIAKRLIEELPPATGAIATAPS
jgi:hypothetical protein